MMCILWQLQLKTPSYFWYFSLSAAERSIFISIDRSVCFIERKKENKKERKKKDGKKKERERERECGGF